MVQDLEEDVEEPMLKLALWHWELASTITEDNKKIKSKNTKHFLASNVQKDFQNEKLMVSRTYEDKEDK
jgi:hypothetical protein